MEETPVAAALETIEYGYAFLTWRVSELSSALRLVLERWADDMPGDVRRVVESTLLVAGDNQDDTAFQHELFAAAEHVAG